MKAQPRISNYMGMKETTDINPDGTWLEPEAFCYPNGGMTRKAHALCPDGVQRTVKCGIPDTYFSIPARLRIKGQTIVGYVTGAEDAKGQRSVEFRVMDSHKDLFAALTKPVAEKTKGVLVDRIPRSRYRSNVPRF